jgi:hypothetical protein
MSGIPMDGPLPPGITLPDGAVIRVTAVDATDGSTVTSVVVSSVAIEAEITSGAAALEQIGFKLVPGPSA